VRLVQVAGMHDVFRMCVSVRLVCVNGSPAAAWWRLPAIVRVYQGALGLV
jgi:hypothetical protein